MWDLDSLKPPNMSVMQTESSDGDNPDSDSEPLRPAKRRKSTKQEQADELNDSKVCLSYSDASVRVCF